MESKGTAKQKRVRQRIETSFAKKSLKKARSQALWPFWTKHCTVLVIRYKMCPLKHKKKKIRKRKGPRGKQGAVAIAFGYAAFKTKWWLKLYLHASKYWLRMTARLRLRGKQRQYYLYITPRKFPYSLSNSILNFGLTLSRFGLSLNGLQYNYRLLTVRHQLQYFCYYVYWNLPYFEVHL